MRLGGLDLLPARISRDDFVENLSKACCSLAVSCRAIPGQIALRRQRAEISKELARIMRPELRILSSVAGKVILERQGSFSLPEVIYSRRAYNSR